MFETVLSILALVISGIALTVSFSVQRKQSRVLDFELKERVRREQELRLAKVKVALVREPIEGVPQKYFYVEIRNQGPSAAQNIDLEFQGENCPVPESEIESKLPVDRLGPEQTFRLVAGITMGMRFPFRVIAVWEDPAGRQREEFLLT